MASIFALSGNSQEIILTEESYGQSDCNEPWRTISAVVGWSYLVAWSASFFPQAIENY